MTVVAHGSESSPLPSLDISAFDAEGRFYVMEGAHVRIFDDVDDVFIYYDLGAPDWMTYSAGALTGIAETGYSEIRFIVEDDGGVVQFMPEMWLTIVPGDGPPASSSAKMSVKVSGQWKSGLPWVNVNGTWKQGVAVWVKTGGVWKRNQ